MTDQPRPHPLVRAGERTADESYSHPLNPRSEISGVSLGDAVGLERIGVLFIRVAPGKESRAYHLHHGEEEFIYVLSGRGIAEIDGQDHEVGPGDFMGFPTPSVAHLMRNPFEEDLIYLSGGERKPLEIADFPRDGKRMVRVGSRVSIHPLSGSEPMGSLPEL